MADELAALVRRNAVPVVHKLQKTVRVIHESCPTSLIRLASSVVTQISERPFRGKKEDALKRPCAYEKVPYSRPRPNQIAP
jgi:hypothetical protein